MPLFSFIVHYDGGIYVSQVEASDCEEALTTWALQIINDQLVMEQFGPNALDDISRGVSKTYLSPTPLEGIQNVWYHSLDINDQTASINIVLTAPE